MTILDKLLERVDKLEEAYKADAEVARDIIFDGARRSEELRRISTDCESHCGAILVLEEKVKNLEEDRNRWQVFLGNTIEKCVEVKEMMMQAALEMRDLRENPHMCPVCIGHGKFDFGNGQPQKICNPCQGNGIVWRRNGTKIV